MAAFLDLPLEIRRKIYAVLLIQRRFVYSLGERILQLELDGFLTDHAVDSNLKDRLMNVLISTHERRDIGCIVVTALDPTKYDPVTMLRSSYLFSADEENFEYTPSTYRKGRTMSSTLALLCVNRMVRAEACEVFYRHNRFFFDCNYLPLLFLKDRHHAIALISRISIPLPCPEYISQRTTKPDDDVKVAWEQTIRYLSIYASGLRHLDLGISCLVDYEPWDFGDADLQLTEGCPQKRREELATLDPRVEFTLSSVFWPEDDYAPKAGEPGLWMPMGRKLRGKIDDCRIAAIRDSEYGTKKRNDALKVFWENRMVSRPRIAYELMRPDDEATNII